MKVMVLGAGVVGLVLSERLTAFGPAAGIGPAEDQFRHHIGVAHGIFDGGCSAL